MHIHFIAIGGAVMHNLAIALHSKGFKVTGSDDEIFEPSRSRLARHGLLPEKWGWYPEKIHPDLDGVILGMHARNDNPELIRARELGTKIWSFPEYLFEHTKDKFRIVVAGSHGKTTITSMIMHALRHEGIAFDYMVGSKLEGFDTMVGLSQDSKIAVFEGDEYLTSPLDPRPKFIHYKPHLTLISGIAWDHMNVFPQYQGYKKQFLELSKLTNKEGEIFYFSGDEELNLLMESDEIFARKTPYHSLPYTIQNDHTIVHYAGKSWQTSLIGRYNVENMTGAMHLCERLGLQPERFLSAMETFKGAAKRQEKIFENEQIKVFQDFAHAPSKVKATVEGFKERYPDSRLVAFLELHTFSSLNKDFIPQYSKSMDKADEAFVYFSPEVVKHKKLPELQPEFIEECFRKPGLKVLTDAPMLKKLLQEKSRQENALILIMSSGNLGGIKTDEILKRET